MIEVSDLPKKRARGNNEPKLTKDLLEHKQGNTEPAHPWKRDAVWPDVSRTTYMTTIIGLLKTATTIETAKTDTTWDTKEHF